MADLTNAGLNTTKNPTLQKLFAEVTQYNVMPAGNHDQAVRLLDKIMKHAAVYLTSKKPQPGKAKNQLRWTAMTNLATQAAVEASSHNVKLLHTPADFRTIRGAPRHNAQCYWLERIDPLHRPGYVLSEEYESWITQPPAPVTPKESFWEHLGDHRDADKVMMVEGDDGEGNLLVECYRITFDSGVAKDSLDGTFCTKDCATAHSGDGWAVFVCSPEGALYVRTHQAGFFHHSSFLAGKPVAAGGELLVDEAGKIRFVTNKTGHYRAGVDEMRRMLTLVPDIPPDAYILPDYLRMHSARREALLYRCDQFRLQGTAAPVLKQADVRAAIPAWGNKGGAVQTMIDRCPV